MQKSESFFWALVAVSAIYVAFTTVTSSRVTAQASSPASVQAVAGQPAAQGMGCMAKGGGCGAMMRK